MARTQKHFPLDSSGGLLNHLRQKYGFDTDSELCKRINLLPYVVSKIRNGKQPVSKQNKYDISVATGLSIKKIEELIKEKA